MNGINVIVQSGNLTRDPEVRATTTGKQVANLGLAVNGGSKERPEVVYWDVEAWGHSAEYAAKYLKKGSFIQVAGRCKMDNWEDKKTGEKRSKIKIVAHDLQAGPKASSTTTDERDAEPEAEQPEKDIPF